MHAQLGASDWNERDGLAQMIIGLDYGDPDQEDKEEIVGEHEGLSVYQLAVGGKVFVVDVQVLGTVAAEPLREIWSHASSFCMIGFCVSSDLKRMVHSFPDLLSRDENETLKVLVELKQFAMNRQIPANHWGLSQLSHVCLGVDVDKEQQCSDWGIRPLSQEQLKYAAQDAFAVRNIALHLLADLDASSCSSPFRVVEYLKRFAVVTNAASPASLGHWISVVQPLNRDH
uniref:3'-5' exonuclease domain-containing protein n=1 Tax=Globisporangium ultimum (strain ATCC 200006 / CBS 805.95 / DAOM BR144) TaxID=431595 RepID=K3X830_GLOUD